MNKIRELRKQAGLTQTDLAQKLQTTTSNISGWECDKWQPDNQTLIALADLFDVSLDELLGRERKDIIERPAYDLTDRQLVDLMKLYKVMTEIQKAHVLGYIIAYLEREGVNVKTVLGY